MFNSNVENGGVVDDKLQKLQDKVFQNNKTSNIFIGEDELTIGYEYQFGLFVENNQGIKNKKEKIVIEKLDQELPPVTIIGHNKKRFIRSNIVISINIKKRSVINSQTEQFQQREYKWKQMSDDQTISFQKDEYNNLFIPKQSIPQKEATHQFKVTLIPINYQELTNSAIVTLVIKFSVLEVYIESDGSDISFDTFYTLPNTNQILRGNVYNAETNGGDQINYKWECYIEDAGEICNSGWNINGNSSSRDIEIDSSASSADKSYKIKLPVNKDERDKTVKTTWKIANTEAPSIKIIH